MYSALCFFSLAGIIYLITGSYMELAYRRYPFYPLCFICAIAGTLFLSCCSQIFLFLGKLATPFKFIGKNSLIMLWVHCFDRYFSFAYLLSSNGYINALLRTVVDIVVFAIAMRIFKVLWNTKTLKKIVK